jgi:two-component system, NarL family, invasion response regulator UvrY
MAVTIAIADDHQLVRKGIRLLLENIKEFKVVSEASNGKELLEQLASLAKIPDLVLVDVNMPVMDGQETVAKLRDMYPQVKIIALSVNDQLHVIRDMIRLGANAYLFKDSSPEMFRKVLQEVYTKGFFYDQQVIDSLLIPDKNLKGQPPGNYHLKMINDLTNREMEFVKYCCSEFTYKEIADKMGVSQRTVDGYRENTFDKLNVKSRTGIVLFAVQAGIYKVD